MLTMGGLATRDQTHSVLVGISSMLTVFYWFFVFGWGTNYHIITSEIPSNRKCRFL
jgi:hypothetical protein